MHGVRHDGQARPREEREEGFFGKERAWNAEAGQRDKREPVSKNGARKILDADAHRVRHELHV